MKSKVAALDVARSARAPGGTRHHNFFPVWRARLWVSAETHQPFTFNPFDLLPLPARDFINLNSCGDDMQKPNDNITVGIVTLPYSVIWGGWLMPDGTVIKNPITAQNAAERLNNAPRSIH
ncbi:DUF1317 family protein [Pantoea dispersa]|uniref:DUF1317 family protein n=1 Tax=Pantoea dispersa TaxID=59814 RepID=UPI003D156C9A